MESNNTDKEPKKTKKKSWLERHMWTIAFFLALYLVRMCHQLQ